jgi:hypothetical protein
VKRPEDINRCISLPRDNPPVEMGKSTWIYEEKTFGGDFVNYHTTTGGTIPF